jgi:D-3-phosphoglycerate dehydrogenase
METVMQKRLKVYVTEPITSEAMEILCRHADIFIEKEPVSKAELQQRVRDIDVLFNKTDASPVDRDIIEAARKLKYIARHGTGYNNIDVNFATRRKIPVSYTPGANAHSVAEYTFGLVLMLTRNLLQAALAARRGNPERRDFFGRELFGRTLGVIGVGQIGREVVKLARGFGMVVLAYHPRPSARNLADLELKLVPLPVLLQESDVVSIHAPLTEETQGMIGEGELAMMKKESFLINMGRGGMVDESALIHALKEGVISGAALDVVEEEPVRSDNPLLGLDHLLVMPHIASMTYEAQRRTAMMAVEDILRFGRGEKPLHLINPEVYPA